MGIKTGIQLGYQWDYNGIQWAYVIITSIYIYTPGRPFVLEKMTRIKKLSFQQSPSKKVNNFADGFLQSVLHFQIALELRKIALELRYAFLSVCVWCL